MIHTVVSIDSAILAAAGLLVAGMVATRVAEKLRIPGLLLFLGVGMAIGDDGLGWVHLADAQLTQNLSVIALVAILFEGGLSASPRQLKCVAGPAAALASGGVIVTATVVAAGAMLLLGSPGWTALLLGAVVAPTDAAAVFAVLRKAPVPSRLANLLEGES